MDAEEENEAPSEIKLNVVYRGCLERNLLPRGPKAKKAILPQASKKIRQTIQIDIDSDERILDINRPDTTGGDIPTEVIFGFYGGDNLA